MTLYAQIIKYSRIVTYEYGKSNSILKPTLSTNVNIEKRNCIYLIGNLMYFNNSKNMKFI